MPNSVQDAARRRNARGTWGQELGPAAALRDVGSKAHDAKEEAVTVIAVGDDAHGATATPPRMPNFNHDSAEAPRQGWLSGPCDCFLTIWAGLGDAIEGGADQVAGMLLLLLGGGMTYLYTLADGRPGEHSDAVYWSDRTPPAPPAAPDWSHVLLRASASFAQLHPIFFVAALLGGLIGIGVVVLFEEDLSRCIARVRLRMQGYTALDSGAPLEGATAEGRRAVALMREATLRHELTRAVDATEVSSRGGDGRTRRTRVRGFG